MMSGLYFYPRLTTELLEKAGVSVSDYSFWYLNADGKRRCLAIAKRGRYNELEDPLEMWQLAEDGVIVEKAVAIEFPEVLKGPDGVVPREAEILPCLLWRSSRLTLAGSFLPTDVNDEGEFVFQNKFGAGGVDGDLTLDLALYVSKAADCVDPDEAHLINEPGVLLGYVEPSCSIDFDGKYMDFPIGEFVEAGGPLWRMQFENWEDPRIDPFSEASFSLLLNTAHEDCPQITEKGIRNEPLLREILAEAYFLLIEKVREFDADGSAWSDVLSDSNLQENSICKVLKWFIDSTDRDLDWSTLERRMLSVKYIVDYGFAEGDAS